VVSLESDKYLSAKENLPNGDQMLTLIELQNNMTYTRKPNKADSVLMHPSQNIIALKAKSDGAGCILQVFNMAEKQKLKSVEIQEQVSFWKWATNDKLAVVTPNSVYYLDLNKPMDSYQKVMDRFDNVKDPGT